MTFYVKQNNIFKVTPTDSVDIYQKLPAGNYIVRYDDQGNVYYLETVENFTKIPKIYGKTTQYAERIINTYRDRKYSTGVLLTGEKGSGKTLLARELSIAGYEQDWPTIIINQPYTGDVFNKFIQDISQECFVLFDEFEKVYDQHKKDQAKVLTLLDGVYQQKKLFIFTCNDKNALDNNMMNRPGRIYYLIDYEGLERDFVIEYCGDNLINKQYIEDICRISTMFSRFNFDMLKALVEEMNRYGETPQEVFKILNANPYNQSSERYRITLIKNGKEILQKNISDTVIHCNPLTLSNYGIDNEEEIGDDGETDWVGNLFSAGDIIKVDSASKKFTFKNEEGTIMILSAEVSKFDYLAL